MRRMKLSRVAAGTTLATVVLTVWLGACSSNSNESCGADGMTNGTCEVGPSCPSGMVEINTTESPATACPGSNGSGGTNYVCCGPESTGGGSSTTTPTADAGKT
jgi:hypothetical protein